MLKLLNKIMKIDIHITMKFLLVSDNIRGVFAIYQVYFLFRTLVSFHTVLFDNLENQQLNFDLYFQNVSFFKP